MTLGAFSPLSSRPILSQTSSTIGAPLIKRRGTIQGATFQQMEDQGARCGINVNIFNTLGSLFVFHFFPFPPPLPSPAAMQVLPMLRLSDKVLHLQPSRAERGGGVGGL